MGTTSYHATYYKSNGCVDIKKECDAYFLEGLNSGNYAVPASSMKGQIYYAAIRPLMKYAKDPDGNKVRVPRPIEEQNVFAVVFVTGTSRCDYDNFWYKDMDETCGPGYYDCPQRILKLLSPTDDTFALEWRKKCELRNKARNQLRKLPKGSKIGLPNGRTAVKRTVKGRRYWKLDGFNFMYVTEPYILDVGFTVIANSDAL